MSEGNSPSIPAEVTVLGGKSWTAYVRPVLIGLLALLLLTPLFYSFSLVAAIIVFVCSTAVLVYQCLLLKSYRLYIDDVGVWIFSGFLPWEKVVHGVKWRDLDEAVFFQSLASWLFKSHTIRIGHRFTKTSEIILSHWARGDEVVLAINTRHIELVRAAPLA